MSKLDINRLELNLRDPDAVTETALAREAAPETNGHASEADELPGNEEPWSLPDGEEFSVELPPIVDAATFVTEVLPTPDELVAGLIHKGTKAVIGGGSKAFKTWVQLDAAISVAHGVEWMNSQTRQGRVLYVNFEIHPVFFQHRIATVAKAKGITVTAKHLDVWNLRGYAASHGIIVPRIIEQIKDTEYALVVIDPIYKLYGNTDENSAGEVAMLMNTLETICVKTGAAVLFGAHYSKGNQAGKESIDRISGSGVFARDPDTIIPFTIHEEENCFTVEPILRNLKPVLPFVVRWQYPLMGIDEKLDPERLKQQNTGRKREYDPTLLLEFISTRTANHPVTITDWAELAGMARKTLAGYLPELRRLAYIATQGEGTHSLQYLTEKGAQFLAADK